MGTSPLPSPEPESPLAHLNDETLIQRYCAARVSVMIPSGPSARNEPTSQKDSERKKSRSDPELRAFSNVRRMASIGEDLVEELWRRHRPILQQKIKYLSAKAGELRPDFVDFKPFVDASCGWAWQKYFGYICTVENPGSKAAFHEWLERVAFSAVGEERRKLLGKIVDRRGVPLDELAGEEGEVPKEEYKPSRERAPRLISRPDRAERQPSAPVLIAGKERKFILRELLIMHAQSSDRARESAHFVRLRHWNDWKCPQIARHYYPDPADEDQKKADDHRVWSRLKTDHEKLRKLLKKEFNVASLRQI